MCMQGASGRPEREEGARVCAEADYREFGLFILTAQTHFCSHPKAQELHFN